MTFAGDYSILNSKSNPAVLIFKGNSQNYYRKESTHDNQNRHFRIWKLRKGGRMRHKA